jgi:hypothetical protein
MSALRNSLRFIHCSWFQSVWQALQFSEISHNHWKRIANSENYQLG